MQNAGPASARQDSSDSEAGARELGAITRSKSGAAAEPYTSIPLRAAQRFGGSFLGECARRQRQQN
jgi:hypothetical protein